MAPRVDTLLSRLAILMNQGAVLSFKLIKTLDVLMEYYAPLDGFIQNGFAKALGDRKKTY